MIFELEPSRRDKAFTRGWYPEAMARFRGPRGRINRALGIAIYEGSGAVKALQRRPTPPGMHGGKRRRKPSEYALALAEKRKLVHTYGLGERQFLRLFRLAQREPGHTGEALLRLCERRIDNVIRRAGFARTRQQARLGVAHGHFTINGRPLDIPSHLVEAGDLIAVRDKPRLRDLYRLELERAKSPAPAWLDVRPEGLEIRVARLPEAEESSAPVDIARVVELVSR